MSGVHGPERPRWRILHPPTLLSLVANSAVTCRSLHLDETKSRVDQALFGRLEPASTLLPVLLGRALWESFGESQAYVI